MVFYRRHLNRMEPWPEKLNRAFELVNADLYATMWGPSEFGPVTGNLDRAVLSGLEMIDSPLQNAWRKYGDLQEEQNVPTKALLKRLETFGRVLNLEQLRTPDVRLTPAQAERVTCVVETVCRGRSA